VVMNHSESLENVQATAGPLASPRPRPSGQAPRPHVYRRISKLTPMKKSTPSLLTLIDL
jgi:hypothetical protein